MAISETGKFRMDAYNAEWMRSLPSWPQIGEYPDRRSIATRAELLRWLDEQGMTVEEFKQTDAYTAHVRAWVGQDPVTGEGGRLRFPWLSQL
jgi:hypothetical protein